MEFKLPGVVATRADILRLYRELESLERFFNELNKRGLDIASTPLPKTSKSLEAFIRDNKLNIYDQIVRKTLLEYVNFLKSNSPVIHISFSTDPSAVVVAKLTQWLRREVHPRVLLQFGIQPGIAGGCIVRTSGGTYDFSLRQHFAAHRHMLISSLSESSQKIKTPQPEVSH